MKRRTSAVVIFLSLTAGFMGGLLAHQVRSPDSALAEGTEKRQPLVLTEKIILLDQTGTIRATFGSNTSGRVILSMMDENHVPRLSLSVANDGGSLSLWDKKGALKAKINEQH